MDLEGIKLSEISQTEKERNPIISLICRILKTNKKIKQIELTYTENSLVVAKGRGYGVGKMSKGGQKVQTSSYKIH